MNLEDFISKWSGIPGGAERANLSLFIGDLTEALDLPRDFPPAEKGVLNSYQYDGPVPGGSFRSLKATGFIDLYRRGRFVLEAKQSYVPEANKAQPELYDLPPATASGQRGYDKLLRDARLQAENYARHLPGGEPRAPFLIVCDIGRAFEIYFDFAGNGRGYDAFPDARGHRIELERLREPDVQRRLRAIWSDPASIDPAVERADVTRRISAELASVSEWLEAAQRPKVRALSASEQSLAIEETALFMMRLLFCMFAEQEGIELLPKGSFKTFLEDAAANEAQFERGLADLWRHMNDAHGDRWSWAIKQQVRYFNGGLFENQRTYPLGEAERQVLLKAAGRDWRKVEPAIFGTLLERALDWRERDKFGAHYTPRAYVERLVDACVTEVLRADWRDAQDDIARLVGGEDSPLPGAACYPAALKRALQFHERLASTRVLDPACGTGNFLYVALEAMARLEGEVIAAIRALGGEARARVSPDQFHGLEKNPRAAKIAELVLWIGHLRLRLADDRTSVTDPVLAQGAHINFGEHGSYDALLRHGAAGDPDLDHPARAAWPPVEFIVGNPPFAGGKDIRGDYGDDYAEALWKADTDVPPSADLVMQWWDRGAAELVRPGTPLRRFGFVTTNSIRQAFSRRVIGARLAEEAEEESDGGTADGGSGRDRPSTTPDQVRGGPPPPAGEDQRLSLVYAVPDHPWIKAPADAPKARRVKAKKGGLAELHPELGFVEAEAQAQAKEGPAAVRIAMTVAQAGAHEGRLFEVVGEAALDSDAPQVEFAETVGRINADLSVGPDVTKVKPLKANDGLSSPGVKLHGKGFIVAPKMAGALGLGRDEGLERHIRLYRNGRDLLARSRNAMVIDLFGLDKDEVRRRFGDVHEHLLRTVKPERDKNNRPIYKNNWWVFGEPRAELRPALVGLPRYIATVETAKHRLFHFLDASILPDNMLVAIASDDAFHMGVLSSRIHCIWAVRAGGWLGVGNDPRYSKSIVLDPFPFPVATPEQRARIGALAEDIVAARADTLARVPKLEMTELYNRVAAVEGAFPVPPVANPPKLDDAASKRVAEARARTLADLHRDLDAAVAAAYGWDAKATPAEIVARLVELNAERVQEEHAGHVRWLRPDYQKGRAAAAKAGRASRRRRDTMPEAGGF